MPTQQEWQEQYQIVSDYFHSRPWLEPTPEVALPDLASGFTQATSTAALSQSRTTFFASKRKVPSSVGLAYKLTSSGGYTYDYSSFGLEDIVLDGSRTLLRCYGTGIVRNLSIKRCRLINGAYAQGQNMGLVIISNTKLIDATFEDLTYHGKMPCTESGDIPAGIALQGKDENDGGENIVIRRFDIRNVIASYTTGYKNADGIAVEGPYKNVLIQSGRVVNVSDACYDFKAEQSRMDDVYGEAGRETYKCWKPNHHGALYSANPVVAHFMAMGSANLSLATDEIVIDHLSCRSVNGAAIIRVENGPVKIRIKSHNLEGCQPGTPIFTRDSRSTATQIIWEQGTPVL